MRRLWAKFLLWILTLTTRGPEPGPLPRYTERAMRDVVRHAFAGRKTHYSETWRPDQDGKSHTLATIYADGYWPITFTWPRDQEDAGRLAVVVKVRSRFFRLAHRHWGSDRIKARGTP